MTPIWDPGTRTYHYNPQGSPWIRYSLAQTSQYRRRQAEIYGFRTFLVGWRVCQCGAGTENVPCGVCGR